MKQFRYYTNCVNCGDGEAINEMTSKAVQVSLQTMRRRCVDFNEIVAELGYSRSFPIHKDWHVSYWKSKYKGEHCYYLCWSRIEYIFLKLS